MRLAYIAVWICASRPVCNNGTDLYLYPLQFDLKKHKTKQKNLGCESCHDVDRSVEKKVKIILS